MHTEWVAVGYQPYHLVRLFNGSKRGRYYFLQQRERRRANTYAYVCMIIINKYDST